MIEQLEKLELLDTVWIMKTKDGFYPIRPSTKCKPEVHGELNPHVVSIEDVDGRTIWRRDN